MIVLLKLILKEIFLVYNNISSIAAISAMFWQGKWKYYLIIASLLEATNLELIFSFLK